LLINKKRLMGRYVNSRLFNVVAWITAIVLILLTGIYAFMGQPAS